MKIKRFIGGALMSNGYIIYDNEESSCFIIDSGYNPKKFVNFVNENNLQCKGIILTHLHHDHCGAAEAVADKLDCQIMMGELDAFSYNGRVDVKLSDGDILKLGDEELSVINTPGHTKGSICIMSQKSRVCFTGDTIFDTDLGRTDLDGGSEKDMYDSIVNVIDKWDNDITIYPGHDNGCTMKKVRIYNSEFIALRDKRR